MTNMFDLESYKRKKQRNLAKIENVGENTELIEKRYDPETGEEVAPKITYINIKELEMRKKQLESELQQINEVINELPQSDSKLKK